jgi:hypothetical protein
MVSGNAVARPAVQIFENVADTAGFLGAKPQTDALLVVRSISGDAAAGTVVIGDFFSTIGDLSVSTASGFNSTDDVLLGDYADAVWIPLTGADASSVPNTLTSGLTASVFPGAQATKVNSGAAVRRARARLYFVNTQDQLVEADLTVPYAPTDTQVTNQLAIAEGVENLQITCAVAVGTGVGACPAPITTAETTEAATALGTFGAGGGARLDSTTISTLRTVTLSVSIRSQQLRANPELGDPPTPLQGVTLDASAAPAGAQYLRRTYQMGIAVRNTSLDSL